MAPVTAAMRPACVAPSRALTPRFGEAEEIAGIVAWLASPEGLFVPGASLTIDGGANA